MDTALPLGKCETGETTIRPARTRDDADGKPQTSTRTLRAVGPQTEQQPDNNTPHVIQGGPERMQRL